MNRKTDGELMELSAKGNINAMAELRRRWAAAAAGYRQWQIENPGRYLAAK